MSEDLFETIKETSLITPNLEKKVRKNKKSKNNENEFDVDSDSGISNINDMFNKFLASNAKVSNLNDEEVMIIPTGIDVLDYILGGGFRTKFTTLVGHSGGGKSTLACNVIKNGQKIWGDNFIATYIDSEESMTLERLEQLGVKGNVRIVNNVSIEKVFEIVESLCAFKESNPELIKFPSVIVWDSIASTQSEKIIESDGPTNMDAAHRAKILSHYLPIYVSKLAQYNIALIAVNQYRDELDVGNPYQKKEKELRYAKQGKTIPGGHAVKFQSFHLLDVAQKAALKDDPYGFPAVETKVYALKNKSFRPNISVDLIFSFEKGFLNFWTNFNFLKNTKFIEQGGSRCYLRSMPDIKLKQKEAIKLYRENPEWKEAFDKDLQEALHVTFDTTDDLSDQYDI